MNSTLRADRVALCSIATLFATLPAAAQTTTKVSVSSTGQEANTSCSTGDFSADGMRVAFASVASNLVPGDVNQQVDVFVHDRTSGTTTLCSVSSSGAASNGFSFWPELSSDGRWVAFTSMATNLAPGDNNAATDVFVHDLESGATEIVSLASNGAIAPLGGTQPSLSADGRFVVFSTQSPLVAEDTNGFLDVYVRDRELGHTELVSVGLAGLAANSGSIDRRHAISGDGRWVAFESPASDLVVGDSNELTDTFVRDRLTGTTILASLAFDGSSSSSGIVNDSVFLSESGGALTFASASSNLVPGDTNGQRDVFVRDLVLGATTRVSVSTSGVQGNGESFARGISPDGSIVIFDSFATNLDTSDTSGFLDGFRHERSTGTTARLSSLTPQGELPVTLLQDVEASGNRVVFVSYFVYVPGEKFVDPLTDVFVHDLGRTVDMSTYCTAKQTSLGCTPRIGSSSVPSLATTDAFHVVAHEVRNQKFGILFWGREAAAIPFHGGFLCIHQPLQRTEIQDSAGSATGNHCDGFYSFHWSQAFMASEIMAVGETFHAQYWSRDPGFPPPDNLGLSDGLSLTIIP